VIFRLNVAQALEEFSELTANILERQGVEGPARTAALQVYIDKLLEKHDLTRDIRLMDPNTRSKMWVFGFPLQLVIVDQR
jgi:hypothetical protein